MQKYKLIFNNRDTNKQEIIVLNGLNDYEEITELCFIDKFTSVFKNELECVEYLKSKNLIDSLNGHLSILRPTGEVSAESILYNNNYFKFFSKEICDKKRSGIANPRLVETYEQKEVCNKIINYLKNEKQALNYFNKTYFQSKKFVQLLNKYFEISVPKGWTEPGEQVMINSIKKEVYSMLKNYETLRSVYIWIQEYKINREKKQFQGYNSNIKVKNPYEEYEKKNNL